MAERKSPTAVLREGPRPLSDDQVRKIEESALTEVLNVDIDESLAVIGSVPAAYPEMFSSTR